MRHLVSLVCVLAVFASIGCSDSSSSVVSGTDGEHATVATDGDVFQVAEVNPAESEVRVLACHNAPIFIFDDEECDLKKFAARTTIQNAIKERYPNATITRILRGGREQIRRQVAAYTFIIYYVSLRFDETEKN